MCLFDLDIHGRKFTWSKGSSSSRIDKMTAETEWLLKFLDMKLKALPSKLSDHSPLFLEVSSQGRNPKPFRCLDAWFTHSDFRKTMQQEWRPMGTSSVVEKLNKLKAPLQRWNKEVFGNIDTNINKFEKELEVVERRIDAVIGDKTDFARLQAIKSQLQT